MTSNTTKTPHKHVIWYDSYGMNHTVSNESFNSWFPLTYLSSFHLLIFPLEVVFYRGFFLPWFEIKSEKLKKKRLKNIGRTIYLGNHLYWQYSIVNNIILFTNMVVPLSLHYETNVCSKFKKYSEKIKLQRNLYLMLNFNIFSVVDQIDCLMSSGTWVGIVWVI